MSKQIYYEATVTPTSDEVDGKKADRLTVFCSDHKFTALFPVGSSKEEIANRLQALAMRMRNA